jgi:hypothetical protein
LNNERLTKKPLSSKQNIPLKSGRTKYLRPAAF